MQLDIDLVGSNEFQNNQLDPSLNDDFFINSEVFSLSCDLNQDVSNSSRLDDFSPSQSTSSFSYQYSPGSGSIDSGVSNSVDLSIPDSPQQLSPNSIDGNYKEYCYPKSNMNYKDSIFAAPGNSLSFQKEQLDKYIQEQVTQALYQQQLKQMTQIQQQKLNQNLFFMQPKVLQEDNKQQPVQHYQAQQPNQINLHLKHVNQHHHQQQQQQLPQQLPQLVNTPTPAISNGSKSESQLIKMLTNKKNNFVNALQGKKDKIQKNNKSHVSKSNKQKSSFSVCTENNFVVEADSKSPLTVLLMQKPELKHSPLVRNL